ncbi:MAG: F0F1 ATP synthase subunit delta [Prevotellaceae bacterium]|jgi:F-type H+-transporting ATPase subunit delta|nr:F0F1 ATP synthase subunit delta [Prevotellaceae bacterium]
MNTGTIAVRYAKALLSYAEDNGEEVVVYAEMENLKKNFSETPALKQVLINPVITGEEKIGILLAATDKKHASKSTDAFFRFVVTQNRQENMQQICLSFLTLYRKKHNIVLAQLTGASRIEPTAVKQMQEAIAKEYKGTVLLHEAVNAKLIGGFVLDIENRRLDASIAGELNEIKKKLVN